MGIFILYVLAASSLVLLFYFIFQIVKCTIIEKETAYESQKINNSFSVSDYCDRMEKQLLALQFEKEKREVYLITLWWGFDGLRLNEDGTAKWISRKPTLPPQINYSFCSSPIMYSGLQSAICNGESMQAQIQSLQAQQLQALQSIQIQNMINNMKPAPLPAYSTQCCITPYAPSYGLTQNCCTGQRTFT